MRVCQPGPDAFQRASVSGDNLRLIATLDPADLGRPRGLSMAAAVRAPKILGSASLAGRDSTIISVVHSGLTRCVFSDLGRFFISLYLSLVRFTQTDDPRLALARREHHAMQATSNIAEYTITRLSIVFASIFPDQSCRPIQKFRKVQGETTRCNISEFFPRIFVHSVIVYTYIHKCNPEA